MIPFTLHLFLAGWGLGLDPIFPGIIGKTGHFKRKFMLQQLANLYQQVQFFLGMDIEVTWLRSIDDILHRAKFVSVGLSIPYTLLPGTNVHICQDPSVVNNINQLWITGMVSWLIGQAFLGTNADFRLLIMSLDNQTNLYLLSVKRNNRNSTHFIRHVRNRWGIHVKSLAHSNSSVDLSCDFISSWPSLHFSKELFVIIEQVNP